MSPSSRLLLSLAAGHSSLHFLLYHDGVTQARKDVSGKVYLVGAGPGDPGLLTLKGLRILRDADVVVYDYLANPELLLETKPGAEIIYVGRHANERLSQDTINRLLV